MNNLKQFAGLLNDAAPQGEFLAYINEDESKILKDFGAKGLLTPQGIPSYRGAGGYQGGSGRGGSGGGSGNNNSPGTTQGGGNANTGGGGRDVSDEGAAQARAVAAQQAQARAAAQQAAAQRDFQAQVAAAEQAEAARQDTIANASASINAAKKREAEQAQNTLIGKVDPGFQEALKDPNNSVKVDAENEYLAPDIDHFKATQKAINKTNKDLGDLDQSDYSDYTQEQKDIYQAEMNKLKGTEGKNYSFYAGNEGTINLTFQENFKDVVITDPILKASPTLRFLAAAAKTLQQNATTDYGTGNYGGTDFTGGGSGEAVDGGGWIGKIINSDGSVNTNISENEANDIYKQAQNDLSNTQSQPSMVNDYFSNLNNTNLGISENYLNTYNTAKTKMAKTLNMTPNTQQYGYGNSYNDNYSRSMNSSNVFYNYLNEQGLI